MYATCLFCTRSLGRNESLEEFPVGRRLAFDQAKGRLWVVCPRCARWNLSPLEERWEAIEACERAYRGTRLRTSTENIGLARVAEGLELIRIGSPERPEMAAWRYGATFARRYRRNVIASAVGIAVGVPLLWTGAYAALAAALPGGGLLIQAPSWIQIYHQRRGVVARVPQEDGICIVRGKHARTARLIAGDDGGGAETWALGIESDRGLLRLQGETARHLAGVVLARFNANGGRARLVQRAVERIEAAGSGEALFTQTAAHLVATRNERFVATRYGGFSIELSGMPRDQKLALEMATQEEAERRALEGELKALELAWKEAEQIAAIADNLLVPARVSSFLARHRA